MKNNIIALLGIFLLANCTLIPIDDKKIEAPNLVTINTDPTVQAKYKTAWLEATKGITDSTPYTGKADIFGGGAFDMIFLFDKGNLQNHCPAYEWDGTKFPAINHNLHLLVSGKDPKFASFFDEKTALVYLPNSASTPLENSVYVLRLSNNTLYRTKDPRGFIHLNSWDGKQADIANLVPIGKKQ